MEQMMFSTNYTNECLPNVGFILLRGDTLTPSVLVYFLYDISIIIEERLAISFPIGDPWSSPCLILFSDTETSISMLLNDSALFSLLLPLIYAIKEVLIFNLKFDFILNNQGYRECGVIRSFLSFKQDVAFVGDRLYNYLKLHL